MIYGEKVVGGTTIPSTYCSPIGVWTCIEPATGGFVSTSISTIGGTPVVSSAPLVELDGPTLSIRGERVKELAPAGVVAIPENCPLSSVCKA